MSSKLELVKCILLEAAKSIEGRIEFEFDLEGGSISLGSKNLLITVVINNVGEFYEELYIDCWSEETGGVLLSGYTAESVYDECWSIERIEHEIKLAVTYFGRG